MKNKGLLVIFTLLITVFALTGCSIINKNSDATKEQPKAPEPILSLEEFPKMDGSTANLPLMAEVMAQTCGISTKEAESCVSSSKTSNAWLNLAYGNADILLVYEPSEGTKKELKETGVKLEAEPIGTDALVFIVNENNPVDSLTIEQVIKIYSGEITNWSEVGGDNVDIVPFQRNEGAGSQSLFMKLVMGDNKLTDAPMSLKPGEMGELIDQLAEYNNEASAIGYSVFYYANYMYSQPGLKMIKIEGVEPSDKTLADKSYPLLNPFFVAIRADEPQNSKARLLKEWILSDYGKAAIKDAGYIPASPSK